MTDVAIKRDVRESDGSDGYRLFIWCPGCEDTHAASALWQWNGALDERFTINPSLLVGGNQWAAGEDFYKPRHASVAAGGSIVCHSFVHDGRWQFLSDCTHPLAGRTVPMVPVPDDAKGVLW